MDKQSEQYNAEWETICDGFYKLKLPYGTATCSYAQECSGEYSVVVSIVDSLEAE